MSYSSLEVYYKTLWSLTFHYKYSIADLEEIAPFERDIIVELTADHNRKEAEAQEARIDQGLAYG